MLCSYTHTHARTQTQSTIHNNSMATLYTEHLRWPDLCRWPYDDLTIFVYASVGNEILCYGDSRRWIPRVYPSTGEFLRPQPTIRYQMLVQLLRGHHKNYSPAVGRSPVLQLPRHIWSWDKAKKLGSTMSGVGHTRLRGSLHRYSQLRSVILLHSIYQE